MGCYRLNSEDVNLENITQIIRCLADFSRQISQCLESFDWEKLAVILETRQCFFEKTLSTPFSEEKIHELVPLIEGILQQDADSLAKIQDHKKKLIQHFLTLENGRRAVKAYRQGKQS